MILILGLSSLASNEAAAREYRRALVPPSWIVGSVYVRGTPSHRAGRSVANETPDGHGYRGLTINRDPMSLPRSEYDELSGGTIRYGDIRSFDPDPSIDSGRQLPYGLDGVGGFGSDLGFDAGADADVYDRGP